MEITKIIDGVKGAISVVQKSNDMGLQKQLLDVYQMTLALQEEIAKLRAENEELRKGKDLESRIIRHPENFLTLEGESEEIRYCPVCWGNERKLIQLNCFDVKYCEFVCIKCKNRGIYDRIKHSEEIQKALKQKEEERKRKNPF